MKMKLIRLVMFHGLMFSYVLLIIIAFWLFYPYNVITYKTPILPLVNTKLKVGDTIEVRHIFCKYMQTQGTILVQLQDELIYNFPQSVGNLKVGCHNIILDNLTVPYALKPGETARLHYTFIYWVNPLRQVTYDIYSEPFTVIK